MKRDILKSSKKLKRKKIFLKIIIFFLLFLILTAGIILSLYIPKLRIQKIAVEGAEILNIDKIISNIFNSLNGRHFFLIPKNNILVASKKEISKNILNSFPRIRDVSLGKDFPSGLSVKIKERQSTALLCRGENKNECAYIDENGFVFEKAPYFSGEIFLKFFDERDVGNSISDRQLLSEEQFNGLIDFKNYLLKENIKIININLKKDGIYELRTSEDWIILLNERNDFRIAFENFKTAFDSLIKEEQNNLEYIDLRFGNKVFYK